MIIKTEQVESDLLKTLDFDLILTASGFETRGTHVCIRYKLKSRGRYAFGFESYPDNPVRIYNDKIFSELGFTLIPASGDSGDSLRRVLDEFCVSIGRNETLNVLVDYSCMTRVWYAEILRYFMVLAERIHITIYFAYSVSKFIEPPENSVLNKFVAPIEGFYSISVPTKPTALIIGLGYVWSRAYGLAEYFDVKPYLFINDANFNLEFHREVVAQNAQLIKDVPEPNVFYYPLNNLTYTETLLNHVCRDLSADYRIVLAPCGPKPFTLLSLITSLRMDEVDVWRISAGEKENPINKEPSGQILTLKCDLRSIEPIRSQSSPGP